MLISLLLFPLAHAAPAPAVDSLLATVPADAYALVHCRDVGALRERAERNDWFRLLGTPHGEPLLNEFASALRSETHTEMDELLEMAQALEGEAVFFDTGKVAGFVTTPSANREKLADLARDWMPQGDAAERRTFEHDGGAVELVAWPDEIDGWTGRAGHFAAFVNHPRALAIYSGDDAPAVMAALKDGISGLGADRTAPLVSAYLAEGGGKSNGIEVYVDFTPLVDVAEAALKEAVEGFLPDPTKLLGLEGGTRLHASADIFPGTRVDCNAQLHLPPDTLAARLADTFQPLPHTLPADLPKGIWGLWSVNWDLKLFYQRARAAIEEAGRGDGLEMVDAGIAAAQGLADIDPIVDVLNQFVGDFTYYFVDPAKEREGAEFHGMEELLLVGFHAGLVDGNAFGTALEKLIDFGDLENFLELEELAGVDAWVAYEDDDFDGGFAILPRAVTVAPARSVLNRSLEALTRVTGASLSDGSRTQATMDENAGVCFLACVEMTPLRVYFLSELGNDLLLPPLKDGQSARDPFDSQLISTARRTAEGFEFRLHTR